MSLLSCSDNLYYNDFKLGLNAVQTQLTSPLCYIYTVSGALMTTARATYRQIRSQIIRLRIVLPLSLLTGFGIIVALYLIGGMWNIPLSTLTRDPAAILNTHIFYGILTFAGIICWAAAAATGLLVSLVIPRSLDTQAMRMFFLSEALLSLILLADDLLLLHERVLPQLGVPEQLVVMGYLLLLLLFLFYFRWQIIASDYILLLLALAGFAGSVVIDQIFEFSEAAIFIEDSMKFVGVLFWMTYFANYAIHFLRSHLQLTPVSIEVSHQ